MNEAIRQIERVPLRTVTDTAAAVTVTPGRPATRLGPAVTQDSKARAAASPEPGRRLALAVFRGSKCVIILVGLDGSTIKSL